ncbi:hypothetical protein ACFO26_06680 [Lactococcus nasutitermitis]|uniref:Prophage protein n=1 Tax=Lactococcus nasutitermitis TaxID=1652957 RepID=A0ABV9JE66_9LACT|nr:hypothetical protein [Lactococcus nasutitermitis]
MIHIQTESSQKNPFNKIPEVKRSNRTIYHDEDTAWYQEQFREQMKAVTKCDSADK